MSDEGIGFRVSESNRHSRSGVATSASRLKALKYGKIKFYLGGLGEVPPFLLVNSGL